jgi:hypothetical protein
VIDTCCMCKRNGESVDLLLLYCDVALGNLSVFFNRFGMSLVMPTHDIDLYDCCSSSGKPRSAAVWKIVLRASFGVYGRK